MTEEEILTKLKDILKTLKDEDMKKINLSSSITLDVGLDSVGMVYMAVMMENEFGIDTSDLTLSTFDTVGSVVTYIKEHM